MNSRKIVVILGPTAVGKSALALQLAPLLHGEIVSADSMQVYRGMDIGTAKPTRKEQAVVPHHLIDVLDPQEPFSVALFLDLAYSAITAIHQREHIPLIVGGTGLYLNALFEGFTIPRPARNTALRKHLEAEPAEILHTRLATLDKPLSQTIHPHDKKRLIRALELHEATGKTPSSLQRRSPRYIETQFIKMGLTLPREALYQHINQRVIHMIETEFFAEVQKLLDKEVPRTATAFQAIGYKEALDYLTGKRSKEETISLIQKRSRNFAKRQMTWFRRFSNITWFESSPKLPFRIIHAFLQERLLNNLPTAR